MKLSLRAGSILAALALSIAGCDPEEPATEKPAAHEEHSDSKLGPPSPPPPVVPASNVVLPAPGTMQPDEAKKKYEEKPSDNTGERKPESPR